MADHIIDWYNPERGPNSTGQVVSYLPEVRSAVYGKALGMGREAAANLSAHRRTGAAYIEVGRHPNAGAGTPDWYIYLKDADPGGGALVWRNYNERSAMSIEFGWTQTHAFGKKLKRPIEHDGLHILGDVMRRAATKYRGVR